MIRELINSIVDVATATACIYIIGVVIVRLKVMSWNTSRRTWLIIYFCAGASAACYLYMIFTDIPHWRLPAFFGYLYTAMWFVESRDRWRRGAPTYMRVDRVYKQSKQLLGA